MRRSFQALPRSLAVQRLPPTSSSRLIPISTTARIDPKFGNRPQNVFGRRCFSEGRRLREKEEKEEEDADAKFKAEAKELNKKGQEKQEKKTLDDTIGEARELQARTPWHREGSDQPPVRRNRSAGAMTKGKLLTTPSRLLKLILPLTTLDKNSDRKDIEPLALLVHPQQPLSYLERLIQSELPTIEGKNGKEKVPDVFFRAEDSATDEIGAEGKENEEDIEPGEEGSDAQMIDGKMVKLGKIEKDKKPESSKEVDKLEELETGLRGGPGEGGVETYSGQGHEGETNKDVKFVRWSSSTEIGDFIRDAARGKEFAVEIEGAPKEIRVGVPSFNDRTHYLRVRLRKTSSKLATMASLKKECDQMAHRSAQRLALGGFGMLAGWWFWVYFLTFQTSYGWDTMEPVTYLAGLSTIMIGYLWFLYHNREVSYRSALNLTVSKRQNTLYEKKGFDIAKWENLIEQANALRKEIKGVADEYDVEWDEKADEGTEEVHDALREERKKQKSGKKDDDDDDDDDTKGKEKSSKGKEDKKDD